MEEAEKSMEVMEMTPLASAANYMVKEEMMYSILMIVPPRSMAE